MRYILDNERLILMETGNEQVILILRQFVPLLEGRSVHIFIALWFVLFHKIRSLKSPLVMELIKDIFVTNDDGIKHPPIHIPSKLDVSADHLSREKSCGQSRNFFVKPVQYSISEDLGPCQLDLFC